MKFDAKSGIIGLLLGIIIMLVSGAGEGSWGGSSGIGFAVSSGGRAIVKAHNGEAFMIDMNTLMAKRILFKKPEPAEPRYPNNINGRALVLGN